MDVNLDYTGYDFDSLVTQLQTYLQATGTWKDLYRSSTGQTMIEVFCYAVTVLVFYLERRVEEIYLPTAKLYSSVVSMVSLVNYVPKRNVSARGYVRFTLSAPHTANIYIPKFTRLQTTGGLQFVTNEEGLILAGSLIADIAVIQGQKVDLTVLSDGSADAKVRIADTNVENTSITTYVNGVLWSLVDSFISYTGTAQIFELRNELDGTVSVLFGDGKFGLIPPRGQNILVRYIKSDGLNGSVYTAQILNNILDAVVDANNVVVSDLTVDNMNPILGGDDAETIDEIKVNAPRIFRTGDRGVTKDDYSAIIRAYPSVASARVWGEFDETPPNYAMRNAVKICSILQNWTIPDSTFNTALDLYLQAYKVVTTRHIFVDPVIIEVVPYIDAYLFATASLSSVQDAISAALANAFDLNWDTLGKNARYSDFERYVDEVDGVDYHHAYFRLRELAVHLGSSNYSLNASLLPIAQNTVYIYDGSVIVGRDNGAGHIVVVGSSHAVSGAINYVTGIITFSVTPVNNTISVIYQQNQNGDLIVAKNHVLKYNPTYAIINAQYEA